MFDQKSVAMGKRRAYTADLPTGPKVARATVLSIVEETGIIACRRHPLLPLDNCLHALQASISYLTRSSLHRCLQQHGPTGCAVIAGDPLAAGRVAGGGLPR